MLVVFFDGIIHSVWLKQNRFINHMEFGSETQVDQMSLFKRRKKDQSQSFNILNNSFFLQIINSMCFAFLNVAEKRALLWKQQQKNIN